METTRWQYNTPPQDFYAPPDDAFFDVAHEYTSQHVEFSDFVKPFIKEEPKSEMKQHIKQEPITPAPSAPLSSVHRRRSMSVHIMQMQDFGDDDAHREYTQASKKRANSKNNAESFKCSYATSSVTSLQSNPQMKSRYITTAERIYHLQKDTPERFHTRSRNQIERFLANAIDYKKHRGLTVPHSPALLSKTRSRPVKALSRKEREDLEVQELKKYKIKATPVPDSVILGIAHLAPVQRRPTTQPEPFNLTEMKKRQVFVEDVKRTFHANPMPKYIQQKPSAPKKALIPLTVPISPNIRRPRVKSVESISNAESHNRDQIDKCLFPTGHKFNGMKNLENVGHVGVPPTSKTKPSKPMPFSFEGRDKEREIRKNEKIQKFLEEERKLREFHANPIPKSIQKKHASNSSHSSDSKKENKENNEKVALFKAKPPAVLYKQPFIPARSERPLLEPHQIQLSTEKRAAERDNFNKKLKDKEEEREMLRKLKEEKDREEEEKLIAMLRSQTVHKAAPIKHHTQFTIHPSEIPLTLPKSPKFVQK